MGGALMDSKLETIDRPAIDVIRDLDVDDGLRAQRSCFLDELPGAVFVGMTLAWIVGCFVSLM